MKKLLVWILRILPFAYMAAIWIMSSLPDTAVIELPDRGVDRFLKESLHLVEFGILYVLLVLAALTTGRFNPVMSFAFMGVAILYGLLDEIHQSFVPARSATVIDFIKDVIGVLAASHFIHHAYFSGKFVWLGKVLRGIEERVRGF
ncbi:MULTISPECIES: VanZ family protein [unclassified Mesobacillus]|uniref:VanZ family protein n=1 Tax=unclassified Mesobacillus TaxID=2675270 RepID=UPI00203FFCCC|nr:MULTISPECIES: VanZ family protein [unclassified Mesobacillus]MCM3123784.1 VanZ family protein [Mesobacillus sp. MER 33]MCM3234201.1 VanZ family protein [Mesobacillus sp. MER 48]